MSPKVFLLTLNLYFTNFNFILYKPDGNIITSELGFRREFEMVASYLPILWFIF